MLVLVFDSDIMLIHKTKEVSDKKQEEDNNELVWEELVTKLLSLALKLYFFELSVKYVYIYLFAL